MKEKIKKYFGEILLVLGSFITIYNLFNFRYSRGCGLIPNLGDEKCGNPVAYYYTDSILILLGVGVVLLVIGILIIKYKTK